MKDAAQKPVALVEKERHERCQSVSSLKNILDYLLVDKASLGADLVALGSR